MEDIPVLEVTNDRSSGGKFTVIMHAAEKAGCQAESRWYPLNKKMGTFEAGICRFKSHLAANNYKGSKLLRLVLTTSDSRHVPGSI
jgi:hypothetical protein